MKLLPVFLAIFAVSLLFAAQHANAALTERTVTVKLQSTGVSFKIKTHDFQRSAVIDVNDTLLKEIIKNFNTDTFAFTHQVKKKENGKASITIDPAIQVGQRLQIKFI
jgi:hypothetical protein